VRPLVCRRRAARRWGWLRREIGSSVAADCGQQDLTWLVGPHQSVSGPQLGPLGPRTAAYRDGSALVADPVRRARFAEVQRQHHGTGPTCALAAFASNSTARQPGGDAGRPHRTPVRPRPQRGCSTPRLGCFQASSTPNLLTGCPRHPASAEAKGTCVPRDGVLVMPDQGCRGIWVRGVRVSVATAEEFGDDVTQAAQSPGPCPHGQDR